MTYLMIETIYQKDQECHNKRENNVNQQVAIFQFLVGQEPSYEAVAEKDHKEDDGHPGLRSGPDIRAHHVFSE